MEVILLERVAKLGQIGDTVKVKGGFARNFLLPNGKALRATEANKKKFEGMKAQIEAQNLERKQEAEAVAKKVDGKSVILVRQAGETGQLYGSVSTRDIADALTKDGISVERRQIVLNAPIKVIGLHTLPVSLHPEVEVKIIVNVARTPDEAERQARGEDLSVSRSDRDEEIAEAKVEADKFFEQTPDELQGGDGAAEEAAKA